MNEKYPILSEYLLILEPDKWTCELFKKASEKFRNDYRIKCKYTYQPLITLMNVLLDKQCNETALMQVLNKRIAKIKYVRVKLWGFDVFSNSGVNNVLYIRVNNVEKVNNIVKKIQTEVRKNISSSKGMYFSNIPHVTIARRIDHEGLMKVKWFYIFRPFWSEFNADYALLLKRKILNNRIVDRFREVQRFYFDE